MSDNNNHKRKYEDDEDDNRQKNGKEEKKVRFRNDPDVRMIESKEEYNRDSNNNNNSSNSRNVKLYDDDELLEQIKRAEAKDQEKETQAKAREKLLVEDERRSRKFVEITNEEGIIQRVDGEEDYQVYDQDIDNVDITNGRRSQQQNKQRQQQQQQQQQSENRVREEDDDSDDEIEVVAFNLREEKQSGRFRDDGTYEEDEQDGEDRDPWLEEYDQVMKNKVANKLSRKELAAQEEEDKNKDDDDEDQWDKEDRELALKKKRGPTAQEKDTRRACLVKIVKILNDGETVVAALRRLGSGNKKPTIKKKLNKHQQLKQAEPMSDVQPIVSESAEAEQQLKSQQFLDLTESSDYLLADGYMNIYSDKKETIQAILYKDAGKQPLQQNKEGNGITTTTTTTSTTNSKEQWEYQLGDGNVYSGFSTDDMREWKNGGYFQNQIVCARKVGTNDDFINVEQINF